MNASQAVCMNIEMEGPVTVIGRERSTDHPRWDFRPISNKQIQPLKSHKETNSHTEIQNGQCWFICQLVQVVLIRCDGSHLQAVEGNPIGTLSVTNALHLTKRKHWSMPRNQQIDLTWYHWPNQDRYLITTLPLLSQCVTWPAGEFLHNYN